MRFLKSLFSKKKPISSRTLTHPNELQVNDIFSFGDSFCFQLIAQIVLVLIGWNAFQFNSFLLKRRC